MVQCHFNSKGPSPLFVCCVVQHGFKWVHSARRNRSFDKDKVLDRKKKLTTLSNAIFQKREKEGDTSAALKHVKVEKPGDSDDDQQRLLERATLAGRHNILSPAAFANRSNCVTYWKGEKSKYKLVSLSADPGDVHAYPSKAFLRAQRYSYSVAEPWQSGGTVDKLHTVNTGLANHQAIAEAGLPWMVVQQHPNLPWMVALKGDSLQTSSSGFGMVDVLMGRPVVSSVRVMYNTTLRHRVADLYTSVDLVGDIHRDQARHAFLARMLRPDKMPFHLVQELKSRSMLSNFDLGVWLQQKYQFGKHVPGDHRPHIDLVSCFTVLPCGYSAFPVRTWCGPTNAVVDTDRAVIDTTFDESLISHFMAESSKDVPRGTYMCVHIEATALPNPGSYPLDQAVHNMQVLKTNRCVGFGVVSCVPSETDTGLIDMAKTLTPTSACRPADLVAQFVPKNKFFLDKECSRLLAWEVGASQVPPEFVAPRGFAPPQQLLSLPDLARDEEPPAAAAGGGGGSTAVLFGGGGEETQMSGTHTNDSMGRDGGVGGGEGGPGGHPPRQVRKPLPLQVQAGAYGMVPWDCKARAKLGEDNWNALKLERARIRMEFGWDRPSAHTHSRKRDLESEEEESGQVQDKKKVKRPTQQQQGSRDVSAWVSESEAEQTDREGGVGGSSAAGGALRARSRRSSSVSVHNMHTRSRLQGSVPPGQCSFRFACLHPCKQHMFVFCVLQRAAWAPSQRNMNTTQRRRHTVQARHRNCQLVNLHPTTTTTCWVPPQMDRGISSRQSNRGVLREEKRRRKCRRNRWCDLVTHRG